MDGLDLQRLITALLMPLPLGLLLASTGLVLLAASRWRRTWATRCRCGGGGDGVGALMWKYLSQIPPVVQCDEGLGSGRHHEHKR